MVSILEYDKEYEEKKLRQAEYEAGEQAGLKKGEQIGMNRGLAQGIVETGCAFGMPKEEASTHSSKATSSTVTT